MTRMSNAKCRRVAEAAQRKSNKTHEDAEELYQALERELDSPDPDLAGSLLRDLRPPGEALGVPSDVEMARLYLSVIFDKDQYAAARAVHLRALTDLRGKWVSHDVAVSLSKELDARIAELEARNG